MVERDEVAKYYIQCELDNIVVGENVQLVEQHYANNTTRLLEALSFTYRINHVFDCVEDGTYTWYKREVAVDDIVLLGIGEALTPIIYSEAVQQNPRKFVEYIRQHQDEPDFDELRPHSVPVNRRTVILMEHEGRLAILDGSHRFLSMVQQGAETVQAYVAVAANPSSKPMIGDATFVRLRKLWERTDDLAFQQAIEQTVLGMMEASSDGARAVERYWASPNQKESVRAVGRRLLDMMS